MQIPGMKHADEKLVSWYIFSLNITESHGWQLHVFLGEVLNVYCFITLGYESDTHYTDRSAGSFGRIGSKKTGRQGYVRQKVDSNLGMLLPGDDM